MTVLDLFRDDIQIIGGTIIHQQLPVAVKNHASERRDILEGNPIVLRLGSIARSSDHLKMPQSQDQDAEDGNNKKRDEFKSSVEGLNENWIESRTSQSWSPV